MSAQKTPRTGSVGWIDLTVDDAPAVRDFYAGVAGWQPSEVAMDGYADFVMAAADGEAVAGVCHARGGNAGLPPVWLIYIVVEDLDASLSRCTEMGGSIVMEPRSMGAARYSVISDPAGAHVALYEP